MTLWCFIELKLSVLFREFIFNQINEILLFRLTMWAHYICYEINILFYCTTTWWSWNLFLIHWISCSVGEPTSDTLLGLLCLDVPLELLAHLLQLLQDSLIVGVAIFFYLSASNAWHCQWRRKADLQFTPRQSWKSTCPWTFLSASLTIPNSPTKGSRAIRARQPPMKPKL